ncbi:MAG: hypothetical protein AB3N23_03125 [Paracoccaceae bacterium]
MSQIEELQSRITAAMERIGTGLETLANQDPPTAEPDPAVLEQLEEEKLANAQLQERLRRIKARHEEQLDQLNADLSVQTEAMARLDMDLQRLRQANEQLRASNADLRKANEEGVGDPNLINKAMLSELEALRATQAADSAENSAILSRLEPLLAAAAAAVTEEEEDA